jgi:hypothetical protein
MALGGICARAIACRLLPPFVGVTAVALPALVLPRLTYAAVAAAGGVAGGDDNEELLWLGGELPGLPWHTKGCRLTTKGCPAYMSCCEHLDLHLLPAFGGS